MSFNCDVKGCPRKATHSFGKDDSSHLCSPHNEAWGYFHKGYLSALGRADSRRLNRKIWDTAMRHFLEKCRIEIIAYTKIVEAYLPTIDEKEVR